MIQEIHTPVLLRETIDGLNLKKDFLVIDATIDGGGHAIAILEKLGKEGKLIGLDLDSGMIAKLQERLGWDDRVKLFHSNFSDVEKVTRTLAALWRRPDAVLFDLGLSSLQLLASGRGFSFNSEEGLEMTFDRSTRPNAREFLAEVPENELADIIWKYGQDRFAKRIARGIVYAREKKRIYTAKELANIIARSIRRRGRLHQATRTFQALRIYLNNELENILRGVDGAFKILKPGGRIAVISYHSLEDRIIKNIFKEKTKRGEAKLVFKKPLKPGRKEVSNNPRSRSAKLRIIEKAK